MPRTDCPSEQELLAFHLGTAPAETVRQVGEHLETCRRCEAALQELDDSTDPVLAALRRPMPAGSAVAEASQRPLQEMAGRQPAREAVDLTAPEHWPRLSGYEVLGTLGRGGMGVVYKAQHLRLGRLVALKRLRAQSPQELARSRTEAEALARFHHPNIVPIYELIEHDGLAYLALELVEGGSLREHLTGKPQPPRLAAELIETLARAVHHAHQRGIVHRDLKPANILLSRIEDGGSKLEDRKEGANLDLRSSIFDPRSSVKITDFGVAKRLSADSGATQEGDVIGTPSYMAPEQSSGQVHQVGPATDVYSLGVILYELLTGRVPLQGPTTLDTLVLVRTEEPVPPRRLQPTVPRDLETICLKCLHKEPHRRYASAAELADDLGRWQRHEPIHARPIGPAERLLRWCQRKPALASLAAALLLVTGMGLAGVLWQWGQAVAARDVAEDARTRAEGLAGELRAQYQQTLRQTYRTHILAAAGALEMSNVAGARALLAAAPAEFRNWEWRHFTSQLDGARRVLGGFPAELWGKPLSPDGRRLATLAGDRTLHLLDAATGAELPIEGGPDPTPYRYVIFTPNSRWIVARARDETLHVLDGQTGARLAVLRPAAETGGIYYSLSPDSRYVAAVRGNKGLRLWELPTGTDCTPPPLAGEEAYQLAFRADGRRLAYARRDGTVRVVETSTGREAAVLPGHGALLASLAFSPDGAFLATGGYYPDNTVRLWRADTGALVAELHGHKNTIELIGFSPDSARLASVSADQSGRLWDGRTGRLIAVLHGHAGPVGSLAFSPDGRHLVSASEDGSLRLWDPDTGVLVGVLRGHTGAVFIGTFGAGDLLASTSADGTIRLWDLREAGRGLLRGHGNYVYDVAFRPEGTRLASAGWDGQVRRWDVADGRALAPLVHGEAILFALAYSPDGQRLAVASGRAEGFAAKDPRLHVWDLETGRRRFSADAPSVIRSVAWGRCGGALAAGGDDGRVHRWDAETGTLAEPLSGHTGSVSSVAFRPGGDLLASGSNDRTVRLWDATTGVARAVLPGHPGPVYRLAWSADGRLLAAAAEKAVYLWDVEARAVVAVFSHASQVYGVAFTPDGTRLAAGCRDNTIRVWDVAAQEEVAQLRGHTDYVHAVAFSPDGTRLASGSGDFTVRLWDTLSAQERAGRR